LNLILNYILCCPIVLCEQNWCSTIRCIVCDKWNC
jgi:hypothetical protein